MLSPDTRFYWSPEATGTPLSSRNPTPHFGTSRKKSPANAGVLSKYSIDTGHAARE